MSYDRILWRLRRAPTTATLRALVDELEDRLVRDPPDETVRRELEALLRERGVAARGLDRTWSPSAGETYVLLVSAAGGAVGRLRVVRGGRPHQLRASLEGGGALDPTAYGQAHLTLAALAECLARRGVGVPDVSRLGHELVVSSAGTGVDGRSLGVALAAALVSCWSGRAPRSDVAATAALSTQGELETIAGLEAKLDALAHSYPRVRRVVVARAQQPLEATELAGITLVRHDTIEDALGELGLSLAEVTGELLPASDAERLVGELPSVHSVDYAAEEWREHALRARLLATHAGVHEEQRLVARAFGVLFHLHAGDEAEAKELSSSLSDEAVESLPAAVGAWVWFIKASAAIDNGALANGRAWAERACHLAETTSGKDRRDVLGRARGTLGRALMHAGEDEAAVPLLRSAAEHHQAELRREAARSWNTLAIALRRAGRYEDALDALAHASRAIANEPGEKGSATSILFMHYERGRTFFDLGRFDEARTELELVRQRSDSDYPRVGCLRYFAAIDASRGEGSASEWLERALDVAEKNEHVIGRIAATAAMALSYSPDASLLRDLRPRLEAVWQSRFGRLLTEDSVSRVLRELVY